MEQILIARLVADEIADTFEQASARVGALAAEYSIAADGIEIELRLANPVAGTRHQLLQVPVASGLIRQS